MIVSLEMATTSKSAKRRFATMTKEERREVIRPALEALAEKRAALKVAQAIRMIHASGGLSKALARVKKAGIELELAS